MNSQYVVLQSTVVDQVLLYEKDDVPDVYNVI